MPHASWSSTPIPSPTWSSGGCWDRPAGRCRCARSICGSGASTATCGDRTTTAPRWGWAACTAKSWRPSKIVNTEKFDEAWYPGEAVDTLLLVERAGRTTLTQTVLYESRAARDAVLKSGMEKGVAASYDRLAELLASTKR